MPVVTRGKALKESLAGCKVNRSRERLIRCHPKIALIAHNWPREAVAVLLVVLYHASVPYLTGGFVGVDIFFVISGFLITTHIAESLESSRFTFTSFYARRVRRILPASFAVLVLSLAVAWLVLPPLQLARISRDAAWTALYIPNLLFAREGTNYLAAPEPSLFQHYWSLGIEEQFYLFWPLILWAVYRFSRRNLRVVMWTVIALVAASLVGSIVLTPEFQPYAFFLLPTRAWELGIGGIVAFALLRRRPDFTPLVRGLLGGIALLVLLATAFIFDSGTLFPSYNAAIPVIAAAVLIYAGPYDGVLGAMLQNRVAQWIGAISYSVYLVHWPLLIIPAAANSWAAPLPLWQSLLLGLASIPLGWLSYRFIETPFRKPRGTGKRAIWMPLTAAVACGVLVAGVAVIGMRSIPTMQLTKSEAAPEFTLTKSPVSAEFIGDNLSVSLQNAQSEMAVPSGAGCDLSSVSPKPAAACTYGSDPDALSVALVGDSHASQWAPGLEELAAQGSIFLTAHTRSACSLHDRSLTGEVRESAVCATWKNEVIDLLNAEKPDIILISHSVQSKPVSADTYETAMRELLSQLPTESRVVLLRDTPRFTGDPMSCLSLNLNDPDACSITRDAGLDTAFFAVDTELAKDPRVSTLDLTDYLCSDTCPLVQGNVLVFKDQQHISKTFSRAMAPALDEALHEVE